MKIFYTRGKKKTEIPVYGPCTLKIYQVPAAYSKDELFAALWSPSELEPVPACGHAEAVLLAHVGLVVGESGSLALAEHHIAEGEVRYG